MEDQELDIGKRIDAAAAARACPDYRRRPAGFNDGIVRAVAREMNIVGVDAVDAAAVGAIAA